MAFLDNLEAHWKLNEASGARVDSHGSNDLADNNTVGQAAGKIGNAAQFVNADLEYLSIADNASLSMGDIEMTVALWAYLDNKTGDQAFLGKFNWGADQREYAIRYDDSSDRIRFHVSSNGTIGTEIIVAANSLGSPSTATWYFIVAWHDPATNLIYIQVNDGAVDSVAASAGIFNGTSDLMLGAWKDGTDSLLDGRVDSVSVWKRVLTAQERTDLYNGGAGFDYPFAAPTPVSKSVLVPWEALRGFRYFKVTNISRSFQEEAWEVEAVEVK